MGKFGSFLGSELIGKYFDVTYEVINTTANLDTSRAGTPLGSVSGVDVDGEGEEGSMNEGVVEVEKKKGGKGKGGKGKGKEKAVDLSHIKLMPLQPPRMEELGIQSS